MTFRQFISARFAERRARRAHKAMFRVYGESWARNAAGVVDLLSSPSLVYVLDAALLRGVVAEALSSSAVTEEQATTPFSAEPLPEVEEPVVEGTEQSPYRYEDLSFAEPTAEVESPREASIFEERNGDVAVPERPDVNDDDKRRAFMRSFLKQNQRAARGPVIPTR